MGGIRWIVAGLSIGMFLCVDSYFSGKIVEEMVHPPEWFLMLITFGGTFLLSVLLKADYKSMIVGFLVYVGIRSASVLIGVHHMCHDCDFQFALESSITGYIVGIVPFMFAGYKTWQYLEKRRMEKGNRGT